MADLLECLIQIKALRETLAMVTGPISVDRPAEMGPVTVSPAEMGPVTVSTWQRLAGAERSYARALGTMGGAQWLPSAPGEPAEARQEFLAWRRANLALLGTCTASRLAGPVAWEGRPATSVADLVAIMLASDTELLAAFRQAARAARIRDAEGA
ncbi:MAG: hypothetical protein R6V57_07440 [Vicinamibacterales bacterium]